MKNSTIIRVVLVGAFAIISIIGVQTYWVLNTWNVKEQEFHERVVVALLNVAKQFEKLGNQLPAYDLITQVTTNYYVVNINDVINANNLQFFLRRELEAVGLTEGYEYAIYDCATNKMVYGDYISNSLGDTIPALDTDLPIYDKFTYYFGVRFPNRTNQILSSMGLTITFSALLLLTIVFFLYSIFVILRQKQLSEMQKDFINNMTHEFKTPISTIKISADVFLHNPQIQSDPRLLQYAKIIQDQNQRLNNQVEKVLQLAKIEGDNFRLTPEELDLHDLLKTIVPSTMMKVEELGGSLVCTLSDSQPMVMADRLHLSNIIHNLLDNAIKYCNGVPHIEVITQTKGKNVLLVVSDKGIGIDPEYQHKVFDKFYRVPTGNVHNVKGFGLGLFYIKSICQAHGWKIELESQPEQGTSIAILMPEISPTTPTETLENVEKHPLS
ncbi:MAG: HAMP domain-containing histidine kinase [Saprospirales bacterium]|nr:HAMP domain-containing histidine kinase [Saprospirales bacterium]MBK8493143.1 HAMP domain-containing histidine kinase [Saprospirales bacterium]